MGEKLPSYHPANRSIQVHRASTDPPAIEKRLLLPQLTKKGAVPSVTEVKTFRKLIGCYDLLKDPVRELIYKKKRFSKKRQGPANDDVIHISSPCYNDQSNCCCGRSKKVDQQTLEEREKLFNSPLPSAEPRKEVKDRFEKLSHGLGKSNSRRQYPLSTVCVRWRTANEYTLVDLYCIMAEYGQITTIDICSPYSAIVVFSSLSDACRLVQTRTLGFTPSRIFCHWKHRSMSSRTFHYSNGLKIRNNTFI